MLDQIKIASPCSADWEQMPGTDRVRFCAECKKNVYNLSAMSRRDAEALLQKHNGKLCTQLYRRSDGTVLTADCQIGLRAKASRVGRRLSWTAAAAFGFAAAAFGQSPAILSGKVTDAGAHAIQGVTIFITDAKTGQSTQSKADAEGTFKVTSLEPGTYKIKAIVPGFSQYSNDHVVVPATGEVRLNIRLAVGTVGGPAGVVNLEPIPSPSKRDLK